MHDHKKKKKQKSALEKVKTASSDMLLFNYEASTRNSQTVYRYDLQRQGEHQGDCQGGYLSETSEVLVYY